MSRLTSTAQRVIQLARALGTEASRKGWELGDVFLKCLADLETRLAVNAVAARCGCRIPEANIMRKSPDACTDTGISRPDSHTSDSAKKNLTENIEPQESHEAEDTAIDTREHPQALSRHKAIPTPPPGLCSKCKTHARRPKQRLCRQCHAEAMQEARRRKLARARATAPALTRAPWPPDVSQTQAICEWFKNAFIPERWGQRYCGGLCGGKAATEVIRAAQAARATVA